jgi:hypothetical protein
MDAFSKNILQGAFICSIVKRMLEEEGYVASYFGYESLFPASKDQISKKLSPTALKLRKTPDLVVLNPSKNG